MVSVRAARSISIHVPLAGDDDMADSPIAAQKISIHVPLAGDDIRLLPSKQYREYISIHVPLAGDDCCGYL